MRVLLWICLGQQLLHQHFPHLQKQRSLQQNTKSLRLCPPLRQHLRKMRFDHRLLPRRRLDLFQRQMHKNRLQPVRQLMPPWIHHGEQHLRQKKNMHSPHGAQYQHQPLRVPSQHHTSRQCLPGLQHQLNLAQQPLRLQGPVFQNQRGLSQMQSECLLRWQKLCLPATLQRQRIHLHPHQQSKINSPRTSSIRRLQLNRRNY